MEIRHSEITVEKITRNVFIAKCTVTTRREFNIEMKGHTKDIAKQKLELFLQNKPYRHLDKNE